MDMVYAVVHSHDDPILFQHREDAERYFKWTRYSLIEHHFEILYEEPWYLEYAPEGEPEEMDTLALNSLVINWGEETPLPLEEVLSVDPTGQMTMLQFIHKFM